MSLRPVVIEQFPGLDLRADPGDERGAVDMSNITLTPGRVRVRDGSSLLFTSTTRPIFAHTHERAGTAPQLLIGEQGSPGKMTAVTSAGALVASTAVSVTNPLAHVSIGTATADYSYIGNPNIATLTRWDGTAWTLPALPAAIPSAHALGLSPMDNRMAVGYHYRVDFSDPGAPETFGANNFVLLEPGDGQLIQGMAVFNNQLFVFKRTKFYVFYGNSTDSTGSPIFNYRTVNAGHGVSPGVNQDAICTGDDGVYFIDRDGIYRTTGGAPVKVTRAVEPFFTGVNQSPFWTGGTVLPSNSGARLCWLDGCLYAALPTGAATGILLVWDRALDAWMVWGRNTQAIASVGDTGAVFDRRRLVFGDMTTSMLKSDPTLSADNGAAIVSRYRLPFETYGDPREKRIRETILEGTGTPTVQWSDDWGALSTGSAVTLGTSPAVAVGRQRLAQRGRAFSLQLGAASGAWAVNRVQVNVHSELRPAAVTI